MENWETQRELLTLPRWVFPVTMLCLGWPTEAQKTRPQPSRFAREMRRSVKAMLENWT